jgi:hypothetical protein
MAKYPYIQLNEQDLLETSKEQQFEIIGIRDFNTEQSKIDEADIILYVQKDGKHKYLKNVFSIENVIPKRTNKYLVHLPKEMNINSQLVTMIDLPYHKPSEDNKIVIQLLDLVDDSTSKKIYESKYVNSKSEKIKKFDIIVEILDMGSTPIETWIYEGCIINRIDYGGTLSYENKNPKIVELGLVVDRFTLK